MYFSAICRTWSFVSGWNTTTWSMRLRNSRREPPLELAVDLALHLVDRHVPERKPSGFCSLRKCSEPAFDVMMTIASDR